MKRTLASALAVLALGLTTGCSFSVSSKPTDPKKDEVTIQNDWEPIGEDFDGETKEFQRKLSDGREITCLAYSLDRGAGLDRKVAAQDGGSYGPA